MTRTWVDNDVRFVLDQHVYMYLNFSSASSLQQQSICWHVAPLQHVIPIPSQQLLLLLNAASLAENQQISVS
jgi:hypothetical protein